MLRHLFALGVAVAAIGVLGAGPLAASSPGSDLPADDIVGQQVARMLLTDTLEEGEDRWDPQRLEEFVDLLDTDRAGALDVEVVDDVTGPALAVTVETLGEDPDEVCVVADDDGEPMSAGRPCEAP
jgi:hypothetical protein